MITTAKVEDLAVGDRVFLASDPRQDEGIIRDAEGNRFLVFWLRSGRAWYYAASHLVKVSD